MIAKLRRRKSRQGFGLTLGFTLTYLTLIVLFPLSLLIVKSASIGPAAFVATITAPRAVAAFKLSFGASLVAALLNTVFGVIVAWVLVRYRFTGRSIFDAIVDLPFALPTAVGGIALSGLYAANGPIGSRLGVALAYNRAGVVLALTFIGLPFVVRTVQPVLEDLDVEQEEAAATLGAGRLQILRRVILPAIFPAVVTGFALAFARALGEYGSVVFLSGNMPNKTEIVPLLIMTKLEQFDYGGATAIASVMLAASFTLLLLVNRLQAWSGSKGAKLA